jgi:hypothetical protein
MLGLALYLLPLYAAGARPAPGGVGDRAPGIVFSRYRQAQLDVVADDRPLPAPALAALPPACAAGVPAPAAGGCTDGGDTPADRASRPASPGRPRSPPAP